MIKLGEDWHYPCLTRADGTGTARPAVRPTANPISGGADKEVEVGTLAACCTWSI